MKLMITMITMVFYSMISLLLNVKSGMAGILAWANRKKEVGPEMEPRDPRMNDEGQFEKMGCALLLILLVAVFKAAAAFRKTSEQTSGISNEISIRPN